MGGGGAEFSYKIEFFSPKTNIHLLTNVEKERTSHKIIDFPWCLELLSYSRMQEALDKINEELGEWDLGPKSSASRCRVTLFLGSPFLA